VKAETVRIHCPFDNETPRASEIVGMSRRPSELMTAVQRPQ
jgi:hypothetical protein